MYICIYSFLVIPTNICLITYITVETVPFNSTCPERWGTQCFFPFQPLLAFCWDSLKSGDRLLLLLFLSTISFTVLLFFSYIYISCLGWILPCIYFTDAGEFSGTTASPHSGAFYFNSSVCQLSNFLGRLDAPLFSVFADRIHAPLGDEDHSPLLITEAGGGVILGT